VRFRGTIRRGDEVIARDVDGTMWRMERGPVAYVGIFDVPTEALPQILQEGIIQLEIDGVEHWNIRVVKSSISADGAQGTCGFRTIGQSFDPS
jgi:hypothetical protein